MHQFVQSAIEAAKQGENEKAVEFLKQVLSSNPNDVDAWLVLAAVVEEPHRKRQCLRKVLELDPVNMVAQEELMEMDQAEMGYSPVEFDQTQEPADPVAMHGYDPSIYSPDYALYQPETVNDIPPVPGRAPSATVQQDAPAKKPKKLVFTFPTLWRLIVYFLAFLFGVAGLLVATQNILISLPFLAIAALLVYAALVISTTVELNGKGIRVSNLFSKRQTAWNEIVTMKTNSMLFRLELTKADDEDIHISTLLNGYPRIVKILQKQRPDLFEAELQTQESFAGTS